MIATNPITKSKGFLNFIVKELQYDKADTITEFDR